MQMHVGEKVAMARKWVSPALSQEDLASMLGMRRPTLAKREREGRFEAPLVYKLSQLLKIPAEWFTDEQNDPPPVGQSDQVISPGFSDVEGPRNVKSMPMTRVPIVGRASAGDGSYDHPELGEDIEIPAHMSIRPSAAYVASGDSMMPWIHPGDIVVARLHKEPKPNYAMLVRRQDDSVSVKIVRYDNGWKLISLNESYDPVPADVEFMGYVTGIYRVNGTRVYMEFDSVGLRPEL